MSLQKVEGFTNLRKDTANGGVVNIDKTSFESYRAAKIQAIQKQQEFKSTQHNVEHLQEEINNIKGDLSEIKSILLTLIEKGK